MSKQLPPSPSLEHLRKQGKRLVKQHCIHDPHVAELLRTYHPEFAQLSPVQIFTRALPLFDALIVVAREHGFSNWRQLKSHIDRQSGFSNRPPIHIDQSRLPNVEYKSRLAAQKGLPPIGTVRKNKHGLEYEVVAHEFALSITSVTRSNGCEWTPDIDELLPRITFATLPPHLAALFIEVDRCTSKELVLLDSMPDLHPQSAMPGVNMVTETQDPTCLMMHLDAGPSSSAASHAIVDLSPQAAKALWTCLHPTKPPQKRHPLPPKKGKHPKRHKPSHFSCSSFEETGVKVNG